MTDPHPSSPSLPVDPAVPDSVSPAVYPAAPFAGFWRRVAAFALDWLALASLGSVIGAAMSDRLVAMGGWARLPGFLVALLYFGLLGSQPGGGRSLGMRATGLAVVQTDGTLLPARQGLLRAGVLLLPILANGVTIEDGAVAGGLLGYLFLLLLLGLGPALLVTAILNRPDRRSLHDFAAGSVVVRAVPGPRRPAPCPVPRAALLGAAAWGGVVVAGTLVAALLLDAGTPSLDGLLPRGAIQSAGELKALPGVTRTSFANEYTTTRVLAGKGSPAGGTVTSVVATLWTRASLEESRRLVALAAPIVLLSPDAARAGRIVIQVCRGYDIMIWSRNDCLSETGSREEWKQRAFGPAPPVAPRT